MLAQAEPRLALAEARAIITELVEILRPACERIEIAGSVRRNKPEVKDAEVVIIPTPELLPLTDDLIQFGRAQYALYGDKLTKRWGQNYRGLLFKGMKCELFMTTEDSWGYQYWLRTGPGDANTYIMRWLGLPHIKAPVRFQGGYGWYSRNWTHNGKAWVAVDKQRLRIASEEDLFAVLGVPFIPPHERTEMVYKKLTNVREFKWPEYAPYFDVDAQQLDLIARNRVTHYFDSEAVDEKEAERQERIEAERAYSDFLKRKAADPHAPVMPDNLFDHAGKLNYSHECIMRYGDYHLLRERMV